MQVVEPLLGATEPGAQGRQIPDPGLKKPASQPTLCTIVTFCEFGRARKPYAHAGLASGEGHEAA